MTESEVRPVAPPTRIYWGVFGLSLSTSALLYLHRYVFSYLKPILTEEWGASKADLGLIDAAFALPYAVLQFPLALGADALGVRLVLTCLMFVWCGGLAMMACAPNVAWMRTGQAVLGAGQSAVYACLSRISRNWFPPAVRTTLQGAVGVTAGRLGAWASAILFVTLMLGELKLDWRTAVWVFTIAGLLQMIFFAVLFRNTPRQHPLVNAAEIRLIEGEAAGPSVAAAGPRVTVWKMLRSMTPRSLVNLGCLGVQTTLSTFADMIYQSWIPLFLFEVHHLQFKEMGIFASLPLLGGAIAGLMGGTLNDYCIRKTGNRRWSRSGIAFAGKGVAAILMFTALLIYDRPYAFCGLLFVIKLFGDWSLTSSWGVVTDIGGKATASVFAFNNSIATLGQIAAGPAYAYIAQYYGWPSVFLTVGVTYTLCALSWLVIDCTIPVLPEPAEDQS